MLLTVRDSCGVVVLTTSDPQEALSFIMKDLTVVQSDTNSVRFIINSISAAYALQRHFPEMVMTAWEVQTVYYVNFKAFEHTCWRANVSVCDAR